jgi:hypothetical protein
MREDALLTMRVGDLLRRDLPPRLRILAAWITPELLQKITLDNRATVLD